MGVGVRVGDDRIRARETSAQMEQSKKQNTPVQETVSDIFGQVVDQCAHNQVGTSLGTNPFRLPYAGGPPPVVACWITAPLYRVFIMTANVSINMHHPSRHVQPSTKKIRAMLAL